MAAPSAGIDTSCSGQDLDNVRVKYLLIAEPADNFNKSRDLQLLYQSQSLSLKTVLTWSCVHYTHYLQVYRCWNSATQSSFPACAHIVFYTIFTIISFSCPSRVTSDCLTHLCADISGWANVHSHLHFHKPPSHLHHLDKRWHRALRWRHPLLVSVADWQRASNLCEHPDSNGEVPRTIRMSCHH